MCLWERNQGGKTDTIVIDREVEEGHGGTISEGISMYGRGLQEGECGIRIHSLRNEDFGPWHCSLLTTSQLFSGQVNIRQKGEGSRTLCHSLQHFTD